MCNWVLNTPSPYFSNYSHRILCFLFFKFQAFVNIFSQGLSYEYKKYGIKNHVSGPSFLQMHYFQQQTGIIPTSGGGTDSRQNIS